MATMNIDNVTSAESSFYLASNNSGKVKRLFHKKHEPSKPYTIKKRTIEKKEYGIETDREKYSIGKKEWLHEMKGRQTRLPYTINFSPTVLSPYSKISGGIKENKDSSIRRPQKYFQANFDPTIFPRFEYHLDLTKMKFGSIQQLDVDEMSISLQSTILVYGQDTDINRELLYPLRLQEIVGKEQSGSKVVMVVFAGCRFDESKIFSLIKEQMENCRWCIIVSSSPDKIRDENQTVFANLSKISFVPPDSDTVWNHLTSALELSLIDFLKEKMSFSDDKDIETVLRRVEKCSTFPEVKNMHRSHVIPRDIKDILKRFEKDIVRYGYHFNYFRIIVKAENYGKVLDAINQTSSDDFPEIHVISLDTFEENVEPYNGVLQAQGQKLYSRLENSETDDLYATFGSLALLNDEQTVVLSSRHICENGKLLYIEKEHNRRILLGECLYTPSGNPACYNDMAIIDLNKELEELFNEKRLLNHMGMPRKAKILKIEEDLDLSGEIVHKFGATSQWTKGKVVCSEFINENSYFIGVEGMDEKEFGERGDSGSIIFRQSYDARMGHIEVIAMLYGGERNKENSKKLIHCSGFESSFKMIQKRYNQVKSISFF